MNYCDLEDLKSKSTFTPVMPTSEQATFSCTMDSSSLSSLYGVALGYDPAITHDYTSIEFDKPILIQSRWHKKRRINKKWLKRYGMRTDYIHCVVKHPNAIFQTSNRTLDMEFNADNITFILRPDQKRRGLKIEI